MTKRKSRQGIFGVGHAEVVDFSHGVLGAIAISVLLLHVVHCRIHRRPSICDHIQIM
ncbi:hypothetical protein [Fischerella sp. PCC 9605]|uniref:hypothetical protein n=1 Tax=Fischerella sp. PCC 9605 TaxID=1173024 RepID=UPI0012DF0983|nr:hypothetical protein [Fischerella sp. PCC 9605]